MVFVLKREYETVPFDVLFDAERMNAKPSKERQDQHHAAVTEGSAPLLSTLTFHLRTFDGNDEKEFSNRMLVTGGKKKGGASKLLVGDVSCAKVVRGVTRIEGMQDEDGKPISKMSEATYGLLPAWISKAVLAQLNELNGDDVDSEDEENEEGN